MPSRRALFKLLALTPAAALLAPAARANEQTRRPRHRGLLAGSQDRLHTPGQ